MIANVMTAIYDILKADAPLVANLGGNAGNGYKIYHVISPQGQSVPYIVFELITGTPLSTFASHTAIEDLYISVRCFGPESAAASGVLTTWALMDLALDGAALSVTGYSLLTCERDWIDSVGFDLDTEVFHLISRYRVMVDKN